MIGQDSGLPSAPGLRWVTHPEEAIAWFRAKLQDFYTLPARIAALRQRARLVQEKLAARNPTAASQAAQVALSADRMATDQASLQSRVTEMLSKLGQHGVKLPGLSGYEAVPDYRTLGVIPLVVVGILAGMGVAIAVGIAAVFASYRKQADLLDQIEKGNLTPAEAAELARRTNRPLFSLGNLPLYLALAAAAYFIVPKLAAQARRRTA